MTLRPIETKFVEDLFVQGGYVLKFTNQTFAEFFNQEVSVDIYDEVYAFRGGSKGKRLIAFTQKAQPKAIARALAGLWEYPQLGSNCHQAIPRVSHATCVSFENGWEVGVHSMYGGYANLPD